MLVITSNKLCFLITDAPSQTTKDKPNGALRDPGGETSDLAACFFAKSITLAGVTYILTTYGAGLSSLTTHVLYGEFATSTSNRCPLLLSMMLISASAALSRQHSGGLHLHSRDTQAGVFEAVRFACCFQLGCSVSHCCHALQQRYLQRSCGLPLGKAKLVVVHNLAHYDLDAITVYLVLSPWGYCH